MRSPPRWPPSAALFLVVCLGVSLGGGLQAAHAEDPPAGAPPAAGGPPADAPPAAKPAPDDEQDVVVLKNGGIWTGRVIQEDEKFVVLERTSRSGGLGRITFDRSEVATIRRGQATAAAPRGGPRLIRDEWFLLRSGGRIVGTRHLELWSDRTKAGPGFRLEEAVRLFTQGPALPATYTKRIEVVDLRFHPRLLAFREVGEAGEDGAGPRRYERNFNGNVVDGLWRGAVFGGGRPQRCEVHLGTGTRGRLGFREHLLRLTRAVRLLDTHIISPETKGLVPVRAGFASVTDACAAGGDTRGKQRGHEFHWEEGGHRLISWFGEDTHPYSEEIAPGVIAIPVSRESAEAAKGQAKRSAKDPTQREVQLPEAGIAFTAPDPVWTWKATLASPGNTGWRVLGRMDSRVLLSDVRVEWHPKDGRAELDPAAAQAWLVRRLRGASPDLRVLEGRRALGTVEGAWRMSLLGSLKHESVRTIAVVVDRPRGRVVLLLAAPAAAWEQVRAALERFVSSVRLL